MFELLSLLWDGQTDARALNTIHESVMLLSEEQQHMGTAALKNDASLDDDQLDAVSALQVMVDNWNNHIRPGYTKQDHSVVRTKSI